MKFMKTISLIFILFFVICWTPRPPFSNGKWRAVIHRNDGNDIVFNFEVQSKGEKKILYVLNAGERLLVDQVKVDEDSVLIQMPFFESRFQGKLDADGHLEGVWIKRLADHDQVMPFEAFPHQDQRFRVNEAPRLNVSGRWPARFRDRQGEITEAIGEFVQSGSRVTGTFLTGTGDYRFLEGVVSGDSLKLSGFDGGHAFLFTSRISNDSTMDGSFYSGIAAPESWTAHKDNKAELPDGYDQTHMRKGESKLDFRFRSIDGNYISLSDPRFKNKVVIIQVMGSWCPNCMDETQFLSDYYTKHHQQGLEIIALAYERSTDFERSKASLERFRNRFQVQYPILVTGVTVSDPQRAERTLPQLDNLAAFPTSIFIDRSGKVRKIYTGFSGPGTGQHFEAFKKEFDQTIKELLAD
ncbi:MAG: peroxiredoxin family protein [Flavisolibacter sp.]